MRTSISVVLVLAVACLFVGNGTATEGERFHDLEVADVLVGNKYELTKAGKARDNKDFLVLDLKTNTDLFDIRSRSTVWFDYYFCDEPETVLSLADASLFVGELNLSRIRKRDAKNMAPLMDRRQLTYRAFIPLANDIAGDLHESFRRRKTQTKYATYDLTENPRPVCVFLTGGSSSGFWFESNAVLVSKEEVIKAISRKR